MFYSRLSLSTYPIECHFTNPYGYIILFLNFTFDNFSILKVSHFEFIIKIFLSVTTSLFFIFTSIREFNFHFRFQHLRHHQHQILAYVVVRTTSVYQVIKCVIFILIVHKTVILRMTPMNTDAMGVTLKMVRRAFMGVT